VEATTAVRLFFDLRITTSCAVDGSQCGTKRATQKAKDRLPVIKDRGRALGSAVAAKDTQGKRLGNPNRPERIDRFNLEFEGANLNA
jgi:hypothetical protein